MQLETYVPKGNVHGFIMPDFVFNDKKLSIISKMLYAVLCNYAGERDHCWPSHETLAKKLCISISSVKVHLKILIGRKLIASSDVSAHRVRSCVYYMLQPPTASISPQNNFARPPSQNLASNQSDSDYKYNIKNLNTLPPLPPKPTPIANISSCAPPLRRRGDFNSVNKSFEDFYALYPKKEGKEVARSIWHSMHRKGHLPSQEEIKKALAHVINSQQWQKDNGRYIPMLANYLRYQRWEDSLTTLAEEQKTQIQSNKLQAYFERKEQEKNIQTQVKFNTIRPLFNAIAKHFTPEKNYAPAFGFFSYLHGKGIAPKEQDIPKNVINISLLAWLKTYQ